MLDILYELPDTDVIVCPIGGGGLIAGIALAAKALKPAVRVYGVEPVGADVMRRSWEAGEPVEWEKLGAAAAVDAESTARHEAAKLLVADFSTRADDRAKRLAENLGKLAELEARLELRKRLAEIEAAEALKITAPDLAQLGVIDEIVPEPTGGSHSDWERTAESLKEALIRHIGELKALSPEDLLSNRRAKFLAMGEWHDA